MIRRTIGYLTKPPVTYVYNGLRYIKNTKACRDAHDCIRDPRPQYRYELIKQNRFGAWVRTGAVVKVNIPMVEEAF